MEARSPEENIGEKPKRANSDAKQGKVTAQGQQGGKGVGGKGRGGAGQAAGKCGQTWTQSAESTSCCLASLFKPRKTRSISCA